MIIMNNIDFKQPYNRESFVNFLNRGNGAFMPDDFREESQQIDYSANRTKSVTRLGVCPSLELELFEVIHNSTHDARVELSKETFRMLLTRSTNNRALVVFVPQDDPSTYRLSLVSIEVSLDENKVRRSYSNPRRYSFVLGTQAKVRTPEEYLINKGKVKDWKDLKERFSVEVLTKAFYGELSDWYAWAVKIVRFPNNINDETDDDKLNHECTIRLITRLIFVWFLKQKKLVPVEFFDEEYIREKLISGFNPHTHADLFGKSSESKYYKAILQNLFFAMLNSPITPEDKNDVVERRFSKQNSNDHNNKKLMRYEGLFINPQLFVDIANQTVPFLNGGLFDCLDEDNGVMYIDGFSDRKVVYDSLIVPDYLFFGEEVGKNIDLSNFYGDAKKKKVSARGIIDILKRYNFTIEENTPFDQEVSLDPELLGKVFENLLASYNPETKTTARKQTGSFYTPREIVQYMVDESLVAHLKRTVGEELEEEYRKLMQYTDEEPNLTIEQTEQIMRSLFNCKVLDPACGSGAFPMGMLQQMVHILTQLDPDNTKWREILMQNAIDETSEAYKTSSDEDRRENIVDIERSFNEQYNAPDYARKLYLIENAIFGVDIQPIAVQISKLRFFISLVVDQKPNDNAADNFGIRPLPNLEAKFVAANTLVGLNKKDITLFYTDEIKAKENELRNAKHKIFSAKTSKTKRKYREVVKTLRVEIAQILENLGAVGNDEAAKLAAWDMFDQNASSPFFDPKWMFGVDDGFDIVIGNPPYIKEYTDKRAFEGLRTSQYYQGKMDLWYFFVCYGVEMLRPNGNLCFIATNHWVTNGGASKMRNKIVYDTKIVQLIDFGSYLIFENAGIQTMIMILEKNQDNDIYRFEYKKLSEDNNNQFNDIKRLLSHSYDNTLKPSIIKLKHLDSIFTFANLETERILDKIAIQSNFILNSNDEVGQGIVGAPDDAFLIKEEMRSKFSDAEIAFIKPYYTCAGRYVSENTKKHILYLSAKNFNAKNIDDFPNIKEHFASYKNMLIAARIKYKTPTKPYFFLHRDRKECFFSYGAKIICSTRVEYPSFTYTESEFYASRALNVIISTRVDLKYMTGIYNSALTNFWLRNRGKLTGSMLQVDIGHLLSIPIKIDDKFMNPIIDLVDKILDAKTVDPKADTSALEAEIDFIVYKLYELTYDDVLIINPNTNITEQQYKLRMKWNI